MKTKKDTEILQITQIKIKLSDKKEIELSSEEARKVYLELEKLFKLEDGRINDALPFPPKEKEYIPYPIYIERPAPLDPYYSPWKLPEIWCGTSSVNETSWGAPETSVLVINLTNNS